MGDVSELARKYYPGGFRLLMPSPLLPLIRRKNTILYLGSLEPTASSRLSWLFDGGHRWNGQAGCVLDPC